MSAMALTHWTFIYAAGGLPGEGNVQEAVTDASTTVLAGFPSAAAALDSCTKGALQDILGSTQLIELCGAFGHEHVAELRRLHPDVPVGLVSYAGDMTAQLHAIFG